MSVITIRLHIDFKYELKRKRKKLRQPSEG